MKPKIDGRRHHLRFRPHPPGLVMAQRVNACRARLLRQPPEHLRTAPPPQDQSGPKRLETSGQRGERVVQPPTLRAADLPGSRCVVIENVDGDHRPIVDRGSQGGLIGQTEVLPQPQYARHRPS
jgi:hypothetical protein